MVDKNILTNCLMLMASCLIIACTGLPQVSPISGSAAPSLHEKCRRPFPKGKWQFLHSIETTMPGGKKGFVMGLSVVSPVDKSVRSIIMTFEGLVVFDATYDQQIVINRAISPFDSEEFANGLINDIKFIFFEPAGPPIESGFLKNGSAVCRYRNPDGRIVDIITHEDDTWEIRQYRHDFRLKRTVRGLSAKKVGSTGPTGIPGRIELTAHGSPGYALIMTLVEAVALTR